MEQYDIFFQNEHSGAAQRFLLWLNRSLFVFLRKKIDPVSQRSLRILEIGPGKGYFYRSLLSEKEISYVACDRNTSFQRAFPKATFYTATLPSFPEGIGTFDIIYAGYVVEHLRDGLVISDFLKGCKEHLNPGGMLVITCPNALLQGMEFWNMDFTHCYPTTARNMSMAFQDAGFERVEVYGIHGLLTFPGFSKKIIHAVLACILFFYRYRVMQLFFGWFFGKKLHQLENPFYRLYCLMKQENLLCIGKKK